jgi:hypothetical protein
MQSKDLSSRIDKSGTHILVEGPAWGDADFYGHWLLEAAKAQKLLEQAKRGDPIFRQAIDTLELLRLLDYGIMATVLVSQFVDKEFQTFIIEFASEDVNQLCLMVEMGFFVLTGDRYQMVIPQKLDVNRVKQAHLALAETEDEDWIHPERLIVAMPLGKATQFQRLLGEMNQDQRLADRRLLLFLDSVDCRKASM